MCVCVCVCAICGKAELRDEVNRVQHKFPIVCTSFMLHNEI